MSVLVRDRAFVVALVSAIALGVIVVAARRQLPIGGPTVGVVASVVGLLETDRVDGSLVLALALLGAGAWLTASRVLVWRYLAIVPGAVAVVAAVPTELPTWMRAAAGVVTFAFAPLMCEFDRRQPRLTSALAAVSALGVYGTVPDIEHARALVGGSIGGAPLGLDPRSTPDPLGAGAFVGLLAWTAALDGFARPGAVVGALGCVGVFAFVPVLHWSRVPIAAAAIVHVAVVAICSRVAGLEATRRTSLAIVIVAAVGSIVVLHVAGRIAPAPAGTWAPPRRSARRPP